MTTNETYQEASLDLWIGTLTGKLVASKKSVIRFRWMITVWIGRTSRWDEEMREEEEEGVEWEMTFDEEEEEEEEEEMEEVREEKIGRRRNSNILRQLLILHHWLASPPLTGRAGCTRVSATRTHVDLAPAQGEGGFLHIYSSAQPKHNFEVFFVD